MGPICNHKTCVSRVEQLHYGNGGYYGNELTKWLKSTTAIPKTVGVSPLLTQCTGKDVLAGVPVEMAEKSVSSG